MSEAGARVAEREERLAARTSSRVFVLSRLRYSTRCRKLAVNRSLPIRSGVR